MTPGQLGATQLLAQLLATIEDPHGLGVGAGDFTSVDGGVSATVHLPSGDRYAVAVQWRGDEEADNGAYRLWVNEERTVLVRLWPSGTVEVATRDASWETWGPPITLAEEKVS